MACVGRMLSAVKCCSDSDSLGHGCGRTVAHLCSTPHVTYPLCAPGATGRCTRVTDIMRQVVSGRRGRMRKHEALGFRGTLDNCFAAKGLQADGMNDVFHRIRQGC